MLQDLASYAPDITGMPLYSSSFNPVNSLMEHLRKNDIGGTVVLGGAEITADANNVFENFPTLQYGIMGEADLSLLQFVSRYLDNKNVYDIPGLVYRDGNRVVKNEVELIRDLDELPVPDRNVLMDNYKRGIYWRLANRGTTDIIVSSRGCPFACNFCFKLTRKARYRSPESIHREIEQILSMGIKNIHFMDDLLVLSFRHVKAVFDPIDPKLGIKFKVRGRAGSMSDELVAYLAGKGVKEIVCGYESGSDKILTLMNKKTTVRQNSDAIKTIKKYGIKAFADLLFLYPGEDMQTARETVDFVQRTKPSYAHWSLLAPFNGTPISIELKQKGLIEGAYGINQYPKVKYDYMSEQELESLVAYITREMDRYNRNFFGVLLPNLIDVLLNSGFKQFKIIFLKYRSLIYSKIFGRTLRKIFFLNKE